MKKTILLILLLSTLKVAGQNHLLGIKAGPNWTNVTSNNFTGQNGNRQGLNGGLTYEYYFTNRFYLGAEANYNQRGFTNDMIFTDAWGTQIGETATTKFNYDYLSLPIKAGLNFGTNLYLFGNIGIIPSYLIKAETITPQFNAEGKITGTETFEVTDRVTKFDLAGLIEVGGGVKFKSRYYLFSALGYQHSFTSVTNSEYFAGSKIKHTNLTLSLGLKYALSAN